MLIGLKIPTIKLSGKKTTYRGLSDMRKIAFCSFGTIRHTASNAKRSEEFCFYMRLPDDQKVEKMGANKIVRN